MFRILSVIAAFASVAAFVFLLGLGRASAGELRRPVAICAVGEDLFAANRNGSIAVIEVAGRAVRHEFPIARQLSGMVSVNNWLLATDASAHELLLLEHRSGTVKVMQRLRTARYPVSVVVAPDESLCSVASLWSRRLTLVGLGTASPPQRALSAIATIDLPFAPRRQVFDPTGRWLAVADSFGGQIGIIDVHRRELRSLWSIDGHNIRGLASRDGKLQIALQRLSSMTHTTRSRVFWGTLMGNFMLSIDWDYLLAAAETARSSSRRPRPIGRWTMYPLGAPGKGAGDPGMIINTRSGQTIVALSGVAQAAFVTPPPEPIARCDVGARPTALALSPDEQTLYVANTLGDSISVVDVSTRKLMRTISLGDPSELDPAQRGEQLFFSARLSLDGWFSCHSCHTDGHTNGLLNDNLGDNSFGSPKRVLSLLGTGNTGPWTWTGGQSALVPQIHKSIESTLQGEKSGHLNAADVTALQQYLLTLDPPPSLGAARETIDRAAVARGRQVFLRRECSDCHQPPSYTSAAMYDVGLHDADANKKFNPPSLLGVSQRERFFHDNRASSLHEALTRFKHPGTEGLPKEELRDLLSFLRSL